MIGKILLTVLLIIVAVPANGAFYGLIFGFKAEKYVYPSVIISWVIVIYFVWFR
jgi:hypothetical protein